jgi:hypothetical protein
MQGPPPSIDRIGTTTARGIINQLIDGGRDADSTLVAGSTCNRCDCFDVYTRNLKILNSRTAALSSLIFTFEYLFRRLLFLGIGGHYGVERD